MAEVQVRGLLQSKAARNANGGVPDLIAFLERKASERSKPLRIKKSRTEGDALIVTVHPNEVQSILILNNFSFAGAKLSIREHESGQREYPSDTRKHHFDQARHQSEPRKHQSDRRRHGSDQYKSDKDGDLGMSDPEERIDIPALLKGLLSRRYNPDGHFLDLSALGTDTELASTGMFETRERATKFFLALMKVADSFFKTAAEKAAAIESVSLANNGIGHIKTVSSLADTFPRLKNLDLSGNALQSLDALKFWRFKFRGLQQLVITGNPIDNHQDAATIAKWFPNLQRLNGITVRAVTPEGFGVPREGASEEQVEKEKRARQLSNASGMTIEYSGICLEQVGWELEPAWDAFLAAKETLPMEAFVQGKALGL